MKTILFKVAFIGLLLFSWTAYGQTSDKGPEKIECEESAEDQARVRLANSDVVVPGPQTDSMKTVAIKTITARALAKVVASGKYKCKGCSEGIPGCILQVKDVPEPTYDDEDSGWVFPKYISVTVYCTACELKSDAKKRE
ncbi:hypothetical protein KFE98_08965 [bacterium SCSIO 12741]|nr:hypothetical protein KFE98_08965 [bacterium SCSIO 12741]